MQERRWDGSEKITYDPSQRTMLEAIADPHNSSVAIYNAPPEGAVIEGRIVDEENRRDLRLHTNGRWTWKR